MLLSLKCAKSSDLFVKKTPIGRMLSCIENDPVFSREKDIAKKLFSNADRDD
jgi:hypothetical protein